MLLSLASTGPLHAQDGGQPMSINVRSDVSMGIKGTRGTSRARLEALSKVLMGSMGDIRTCYRKLVAKRPTTVGAFAITVVVDRGAAAQLKVEEKGGSDRQLKRCVMKVMGKLRYRGVPKPAAAVVTVRFQNSRSETQAKFEKARAAKDVVDVEDGPGGAKVASWTTSDGKVAFRASASKGKDPAAAVAAVIRGMRNGFAGFLDCRRRSAKRGLSPKGDIEAVIRLARNGKAKAKVGNVTIAHKRAPVCAKRALKRVKYPEDGPVGGRVELTVTFAD